MDFSRAREFIFRTDDRVEQLFEVGGFGRFRQVWCRYRHRGVGDTLIVGEEKVGWIVRDELTSPGKMPDGCVHNQSQPILHCTINNSTKVNKFAVNYNFSPQFIEI